MPRWTQAWCNLRRLPGPSLHPIPGPLLIGVHGKLGRLPALTAIGSTATVEQVWTLRPGRHTGRAGMIIAAKSRAIDTTGAMPVPHTWNERLHTSHDAISMLDISPSVGGRRGPWCRPRRDGGWRWSRPVDLNAKGLRGRSAPAGVSIALAPRSRPIEGPLLLSSKSARGGVLSLAYAHRISLGFVPTLIR